MCTELVPSLPQLQPCKHGLYDPNLCTNCLNGPQIKPVKPRPKRLRKDGRNGYPVGTNDQTLNSAHHYHLHRSIEAAKYNYADSWARNHRRDPLWDSDSRSDRIPRNDKALAWFLYRLHMSTICWRDEFSKLVHYRLSMRLMGRVDAAVRESLDLSIAELKQLDRIVGRYISMPRGHWPYDADKTYICLPLRNAKRGWAKDVLRRFKAANYKQSQVLLAQ